MKNLKQLFMLFIGIAFLFSACKKGDTGPAGANGANGANGTNGNANVQLFLFTAADTLTASNPAVFLNLPASITSGIIDSSLVLVYHQNVNCYGGLWYPVPGFGCNGDYNSRCYTMTSGTTMEVIVKIINPDGTAFSGSDQIFNEIKVLIVPASVYTTARRSVNFNNYEATMKFFHLQ